MENFLETNSNETSFFFLTLSNKYFKKCAAMDHCANSLECFEYYTDVVEYFDTHYPITSSIEKYSNAESYHLHILIDARIKPDPEIYECYQSIAYDMIHYAEQHCEKFTNAEWKTFDDKYKNPTITYGPSFTLKIVSTIDNQNEVIKYINKYIDDKQQIKDNLMNMLITKFCKRNKKYPTRAVFMKNQVYKNKDWINFREDWQYRIFNKIYRDSLSESNYINLEN